MKKLLLTGVLACVSAFSFQCLAWSGNSWMSELPDDAYVAELSIPGTHDSFTSEGWTTGASFIGAESMSECQNLSVNDQLAAGVRAFDIRPGLDGSTWACWHGAHQIDMSLATALGKFNTFLNNNSSEFIIIHIYQGGGSSWDSNEVSGFATQLKNAFGDKLINFRRDLTVKDMRGKVLVLSREKYTNPVGGNFENWSEEFYNTASRSRIIGASNDGDMSNSKLFVQDRASTYDNGQDEKKGFVKYLLDFTTRYRIGGDPANLIWSFNFLSSYGTSSSQSSSYKSNSLIFNQQIVDYLASNTVVGPTGIVMMDYVDTTEGQAALKAVIDNNFNYLNSYHNATLTPATGDNPSFQLDKALLQGDGMNYSCGGDKAVPIIADFDGDGRMDYFASGQSYEWYDDDWHWGDASYLALNYGFGHAYGFEAYDNSGVKRGEARVADNNEDYLPIVYGAQVQRTADLNQDGAVDFLLWDCDQHGWGTYDKYTTYGDPNNQVFINNGDGSQFSMISGYPNNIGNNKHGDWSCSIPGKYHRLSIADANADGYSDILMVIESGTTNENGTFAWWSENGTNLFLNNGDNTFTQKRIASNRNFYATSLFGDFNCDGYPDILLNGWCDAITGADGVSINGGWKLVIMTNDGQGNFSVAYENSNYGKSEDSGTETAVHVLDYDQDGKMDILLSGTTNSNSFTSVDSDGNTIQTNGRDGKVAFILRNESDGTNVAFSEVLTDLHPSSVAMQRLSILADFNGDGFVDYLADGWGPYGDWSNGTYISSSTGKYNTGYVYNNGIIHTMDWYNETGQGEEQSWITFGDMNGDGMLDLLSPSGSGCPRVYLNTTLLNKNQKPQVPEAPTNTLMTFDKSKDRFTFTWDKMYTESGSKAIYNTYIRPVTATRAVTSTIMRVPADIETGKLKAYTEWSSFLPGETCFYEGLEDGTYEFGVQSVSYNYGASEFSKYLFKVEGDVITGVDEIEIEEDLDAPVDVYNMQGMMLKQGVDREDALNDLPAGLYIVGNKKILKR